MSDLVAADFKKAIEIIAGRLTMPKCSDHRPVASKSYGDGGYCIQIHCEECGFTMWTHPKVYEEMTT